MLVCVPQFTLKVVKFVTQILKIGLNSNKVSYDSYNLLHMYVQCLHLSLFGTSPGPLSL